MINYKIIFVIFVIFFPFKVNAASGCCSHHGGVDCTKKQSNGKVVCNDGWTGSSCAYSGMVKCKDYNPSSADDEEDDDSDNSSTSSSDELIILLGVGGAAVWAISALKKGK